MMTVTKGDSLSSSAQGFRCDKKASELPAEKRGKVISVHLTDSEWEAYQKKTRRLGPSVTAKFRERTLKPISAPVGASSRNTTLDATPSYCISHCVGFPQRQSAVLLVPLSTWVACMRRVGVWPLTIPKQDHSISVPQTAMSGSLSFTWLDCIATVVALRSTTQPRWIGTRSHCPHARLSRLAVSWRRHESLSVHRATPPDHAVPSPVQRVLEATW